MLIITKLGSNIKLNFKSLNILYLVSLDAATTVVFRGSRSLRGSVGLRYNLCHNLSLQSGYSPCTISLKSKVMLVHHHSSESLLSPVTSPGVSQDPVLNTILNTCERKLLRVVLQRL